jgi:hypothetical protein
MPVPAFVKSKVQALAAQVNAANFNAYGEDREFIFDVIRQEPLAASDYVAALSKAINEGNIPTNSIGPALAWLRDFASMSADIRHIIGDTLADDALDYLGETPTHSDRVKSLRFSLSLEHPRHYVDLARLSRIHNGSIVVVGAGFSYDSNVALLRDLEGMVRATLYALGVSDPRELYSHTESEAWAILADNWQLFQGMISQNMSTKVPSKQHYDLADLFHRGDVSHIVSFNWDDLIEKAYEERVGRAMLKVLDDDQDSEHALWKPHGDIRRPDVRWVLPFEPGRIFETLRKRITTSGQPGFVIGYREQELEVRQKLIEPMEATGGITRISPSLPTDPPASFGVSAEKALTSLHAAFEFLGS